MSPLVGGRSVWVETADIRERAPLAPDARLVVDVCVVGGGITGLLTAWELVEGGCSVVVLESKRLAESVTGYTTAKLTSQHGLRLRAIEQAHAADAARWYGQANQQALERVFELHGALGLDGDLERREAWVYASHAGSVDAVRAEVEAAQRAGLPARWEDDVPLPVEAHGAMVFTEQAQLHPRRLLASLADHIERRGGVLHEGTAATAIDRSSPRSIVQTEGGGVVEARHVVLATLTPRLAGSELWPRMYCHQGYAVALPVERDPLEGGIYINADRPMRSLRTIDLGGDELLLQVGGSAWVADPDSGDTPWDELERWGIEHFGSAGASSATLRWTTQDYSTGDGVPFIGALDEEGTTLGAFGFGGWGLSNAGVAARIFSDLVRGERADWHAPFAPTRSVAPVTTRTVSGHRAGLAIDGAAAIDALAPDSALVVEVDGEEVAAYRDPDGTLHRVSAVCTHLRGIVLWDRDEREWQCPCHASRFRPDGTCVHGPASDPLPPR